MNAKDIKRLMELLQKSAATLTEAEKTELAALQAKQVAAEAAEAAAAAKGEPTVEDLKAIVTDAVKAHAGSTLTEAQVKAIVGEAVKTVPAGLDAKSVTDAVTAAVSALPKAITTDDVKAVVTEALKLQRAPSKIEHQDDSKSYEIEFPIAHRKGNLTVAFKQLLNVMSGKAQDQDIPEDILKKANDRGERAENALYAKIATKAITTSGSGTGAELMNFSLSSVILQRLYLESQVAQLFGSVEIDMPTNPYTYPLATTRPVFKSGVGENAAPAGSQPGTGSLVLNAQKLTGLVDYSYEADEDSIIAILPMVTSQLAAGAAESYEDAIINGDTAGTQDSGGAAGDPLRLFDGIRKLTLAQTALKVSLATGGISAANIGAMRKLLGKWGMNPKNLALIVSPNGYNDAVLLPETLTAEKIGGAGAARINTGLAPSIFGIDIIPSAKMRDDLNASGVFDNTTTTKSSILLVYKPAWIAGRRRGLLVEQDVDKKAQTKSVIASFRRIVKPMEALTLTKASVCGYNY
jgi:HK97 family phage major capsid protein